MRTPANLIVLLSSPTVSTLMDANAPTALSVCLTTVLEVSVLHPVPMTSLLLALSSKRDVLALILMSVYLVSAM